jgi:hypothetical protein
VATTVARLEAILSADTRQFDRAMDSSEGRMRSAAKTAGKAGLAGAVIGLGFAVKAGFSEFMEAERVTAQTNAVLKSTGGVANVTAGQVDKLATSLMRKSGVDDEQIKSGQNMLLTFTKIRNEAGAGNKVFDEATKATLNLSVAMGKDMQSSAILVGKALNDPIKGVSALSRAGVQFTADQKDMIKGMVAAGDTMGAQKLILKELETQFGGSAEAAGKTFGGQVNIAKETLKNLAGEGIARLMPHLIGFAGFLRDKAVPWIREAFAEIVAVFRNNQEEIGRILSLIGTVLREVVLPVLKFVFTEVLPRLINTAITSIALFTDAIAGIAGFISGIRDKFAAFWEWIRLSALTGVRKLVEPFSHLPGEMGGWARKAKDSINAELAKIQTEKEIRISARIFASLSEGAQNAPDNRGDGAIGSFAASADGLIDAWVADNLGSLVRSVAPRQARNPGGLSSKILDELGLAQMMGLSLTSGYRPGAITSSGNPSLHGIGQAIDVGGTPAQMASFARAVAGRPGIAEVLYTPVGGWYPGAGWTGLSGKLAADHYDHVHVGTFDRGGWLPPHSTTLATNNTAQWEPVGPPGRGIGSVVNNFNFPQLVASDKRELIEWIRTALIKTGQRNGGGALGGFA